MHRHQVGASLVHRCLAGHPGSGRHPQAGEQPRRIDINNPGKPEALVQELAQALAVGPTWELAAPRVSETARGSGPARVSRSACTGRPVLGNGSSPAFARRCRPATARPSRSCVDASPPQLGQQLGTGASSSQSGGPAGTMRWPWRPCASPDLRSGRFGSSLGSPLENGEAWRLPARLDS